jgi:hypothetical protein
VDTYASDDQYQLISWYNDGGMFEGAFFGPEEQVTHPHNGIFWGADLGYYGFQSFHIQVDGDWASKLKTDYSIPVGAGYYITQNTAAQFEKWMTELQIPFAKWNCRQQSVYTHEHYDVAEKLGRNDFLRIPPPEIRMRWLIIMASGEQTKIISMALTLAKGTRFGIQQWHKNIMTRI